MRICPSMLSAAIRFNRTRRGQIGNSCALYVVMAAAVAVVPFEVSAQNMVMPPAQPMGGDNGAAPMSSSGDVSFFSQDLGTILRLRYNTESYGQQQGNFDVGTM